MNSETQQASKTVGLPPIDWKMSFRCPAVSDISLRDYFAGQALAGMPWSPSIKAREQAVECYQIADAMIAARDGKGGAA